MCGPGDGVAVGIAVLGAAEVVAVVAAGVYVYANHKVNHPDDIDGWIEYAKALVGEDAEINDIIQSYENIKALLPDADIASPIACVYLRYGLPEKAIEVLNPSIRNHPTAHGYTILAASYIYSEKYDEAIATCQKAIDLEPEFEETYLNLGDAYMKQGDFEKAIENYEKAIELDQEYALAMHQLAKALSFDKQFERAVAYAKKSIDYGYDEAVASILLANLHWQLSDLAEADKFYKKAIELDPENIDYMKWYDQFLKASRH